MISNFAQEMLYDEVLTGFCFIYRFQKPFSTALTVSTKEHLESFEFNSETQQKLRAAVFQEVERHWSNIASRKAYESPNIEDIAKLFALNIGKNRVFNQFF